MSVHLVSVVMPCYNAERWIADAIESVLSQTFPYIELIVIDDGSTDQSLEIVKRYGKRIKWESGQNKGGNTARNRGFDISSGKYIQYLDADDYLLPEKLERQVDYLEKTGADAVYGDWRHQHHLPDGTSFLESIQVPGMQDDILESLLAGWWVASLALLIKREMIIHCGGWDKKLRAGQDRDFFISMGINGANVVYQPGCYSIYRRYGNTTTSTSDRLLWLENHSLLLEKAENTLSSSNKLSAQYREALARGYFLLARNYYDIDRSQYWRLLKKTLFLSPNFRPLQSTTYNISQRIFGFSTAEKIASWKRKLKRRLINE